jgi:hypothetical protein
MADWAFSVDQGSQAMLVVVMVVLVLRAVAAMVLVIERSVAAAVAAAALTAVAVRSSVGAKLPMVGSQVIDPSRSYGG